MTRFLRYVGVGAVATAVHDVVLVAWVELGNWPAWWGSGVGAVVGAQVAATLCSLLLTYALNRAWTFR